MYGEEAIDSGIEKRPTEGPENTGVLILYKREGHVKMSLQIGPDHNNLVWSESAGNELDDALEKALRIWKPASHEPVSITPDKEKYGLVFRA